MAAHHEANVALVQQRVDGVRGGLRRVRIEYSRIDAADVDTADAFTRQILDVVRPYGGEYDGWAGYLAADPAEQPALLASTCRTPLLRPDRALNCIEWRPRVG